MQETELIERDVEAYLDRHEHKELLRFVAVGSVDDGKSTLIGRLLYDTHAVYEDQLLAAKRSSRQDAGEVDLSLFTDGLKAEREQGITIDVAYRYFSTEKRKFIIADTPGHVQYTRNMATGASTANVAVILIDARLGVLQQSRRHAFIASLLGIPHLAVCINKMDLAGYDEARFREISADFSRFAASLGFKDVTFFPVSALAGDNVVSRSDKTPWYGGDTLLAYLETVPIADDRNQDDFRYPVQYVIRPNLHYRGFAGQVSSGVVRTGDRVLALPSRRESRVVAIDGPDGAIELAHPPMSVTLRLADEIDLSRGEMLVHPHDVPRVVRRFDAMLVWMRERELETDRTYFLKHTTRTVRAQIERIRYVVDLDDLSERPAEKLVVNDIARVSVCCHQPVFVDAYRDNRSTGAFILIDAITNNTVAAGMIVETSADEHGGSGASATVSMQERAARLEQPALVVRIEAPADHALPVAQAAERLLFDRGRYAYVVIPDSPQVTSAVALALYRAGLIVIVAGDSSDSPASAPPLGMPAAVVSARLEPELDIDASAERLAALIEAALGRQPPSSE
jgi:bifunctional enzyme CysN/CysC